MSHKEVQNYGPFKILNYDIYISLKGIFTYILNNYLKVYQWSHLISLSPPQLLRLLLRVYPLSVIPTLYSRHHPFIYLKVSFSYIWKWCLIYTDNLFLIRSITQSFPQLFERDISETPFIKSQDPVYQRQFWWTSWHEDLEFRRSLLWTYLPPPIQGHFEINNFIHYPV